jgi:prefoldin subunit 5
VDATAERVETRLKALRQEYETGQKMLADLQSRQLDLQQTLLRISGGIQVLEELLPTDGEAPHTG